MAEHFNESRFREQVNEAMKSVRRVLENTKSPSLPADVSHLYGDKYVLAESLANTGLAALLNALELLGINARSLKKIKDWAGDRSITLRLKAEEHCDFDRETTREVESSSYVRDYGVGKITDKVVTTIHEWFWNFTLDYSVFVYAGNDVDDGLVLQSRTAKMELMTTTKDAPRKKVVVRDGVDVNLSFLFRLINSENQFAFKIDRFAKGCHTPRRNPEINETITFMLNVSKFAKAVENYFRNEIFPIQTGQKDQGSEKYGLASLNVRSVFVPVLPLFNRSTSKEGTDVAADALAALSELDESKVMLSLNDLNRFLNEQKRSLSEKFVELSKGFPDGVKLITVAEAHIVVIALHLQSIATHFIDGVNFIENLIRKQLVAAIGKEVGVVDFQNYMQFHNARVFREEYRPQAFCYAVRRPDHYPEGIVSIEGQLADGGMPEPIRTIVSRRSPESNMNFAISASAKVAFKGDVYLHGYVGHSFASQSGMRMSLNARARQFSSFLVLVGRISGPGLFDPQFGMIVQNKDEFAIPLDLETIPTPKEFRDAIESLSPEQQEFAKLYRGMQLSSTLFGVCVLQIKPQMEKILKMENDSLTKEIRLTQDLLDLFIQYQIPSDLLSYGGAPEGTKKEKLDGVKENVSAMLKMIEKAKVKEVKEAAETAKFNMLESVAVSAAPPPRKPMARNMMRGAAPGGGGGGGPPRLSSRAAPSGAAPMMAMAAAPPPSAPARVSAAAPPSAPAPAPAPAPAVTEAPAPVDDGSSSQQASTKFDAGSSGKSDVDFTKIPGELDKKFEKLDLDAALRPTILNVGKVWSKKTQKGLLSGLTQESVPVAKQKLERNTCFDLLDALTNSGCIGFEDATLHIVMASTHCFTDNLMNTLVKDNINPIEKLERSQLIVATTIHQGKRPEELLVEDQVDRVKTISAAGTDLFLIEDK